MAGDDAMHHRKPQPGAFADILGRKGGLEDAVERCRRDAAAGICNRQVARRDRADYLVEQISDVPPVFGDPLGLHQVVVSLVANAAQAIGAVIGRITVSIWAVGESQASAASWTVAGKLDRSIRSASPPPGQDRPAA
jgi:signal transduction histidine kinase